MVMIFIKTYALKAGRQVSAVTCLSSARSHGFSSQPRVSAAGKSLDTSLLASEPDLVMSHLRARRSASSLLEEVARIGALRAERNALITEGNELKHLRNALSQQIGRLMQQGGGKNVAVLKEQVGSASASAAALDERLAEVDRGIHAIMSSLPNLLDDAVPDGGDEAQNVEVSQWGTDRRKVGPDGTYRWHDELAQLLGVSLLQVCTWYTFPMSSPHVRFVCSCNNCLPFIAPNPLPGPGSGGRSAYLRHAIQCAARTIGQARASNPVLLYRFPRCARLCRGGGAVFGEQINA